ncbi:asparagine synthetase B [Nocardioides sp. SYSU D00065]|uniref:asparagine synthetase B family protein n=1 Tax=Nocardioides sp. SYSU D00065 TaxID=2817378 RepID=UPI001B331D5D|nr:asparagine synthase-related protein [Nocardioides sp. SYSU D00065]
MSGIGGVRAFGAGAGAEAGAGPGVATEGLHRMAGHLHHRGPDRTSVWVGSDIGLVHTGLSASHHAPPERPVHSADGRWVLVLDGVVLNRDSLRHYLDRPSDCDDDEVVAAGLAVEGISFAERLLGQFAFVAHDLRTGTTHLVRDRLGVVPLHYRQVPGGVAFASEVKALLDVGPAPQVDRRSLDAYLATRSVPAPDTLFEGVKKVRPAHRVTVTAGGHVEEVRYWAPPECDPDGTWSAADAIEAVGDGVRAAVEAALRAGTPGTRVGVHLSGLAGSLVAAHAQQQRGDEPLHTFSVDLGDRHRGTQSREARTSAMLGTLHHEVRLDAAGLDALWGRLTWAREAPLSDPGDVATFVLARAAREHVDVLLTGEGSEALFGGHGSHLLARIVDQSTQRTTGLRSRVAGTVERHLCGTFTPAERERLLGSPPPAERRSSPALGVDPVDRMLREDLRHRLSDDVLEREDRMAAAASVGTRPCLLDHRLVELASRLPASVKWRGGIDHWVLREAARPFLPDAVLDRAGAEPRVPLRSWFRDGLRDVARERLTAEGSWIGQTFDPRAVHDVLDRHELGGRQALRLWTLLSLEMWHDSFFGAPPPVPGPRREHRRVAVPGQRG